MGIFLGIVAGALGWLVAKFVFEPGKEIVELRREAQEILIVYGNIGKDIPIKERQDTGDAFRRVGAALVSRHVAGYPG